MEFKRKEIIEMLVKSQFNNMVKIITGIRRSGKSYLLFTLYKNYLINNQNVSKDNVIEINLDKISNEHYRNPYKLTELIKSKIQNKKTKYFIFIDEIQLVEKVKSKSTKTGNISFYDVLNEFIDNKNIDIYVTGSNSKMLSKDICTEFRGRGDIIHINPISFKDICEVIKNVDKEFLFKQYMMFGGLPEI